MLREFPAMFTIPALAALAAITVALGFKLVRYRKELNVWVGLWANHDASSRLVLQLCMLWIVPYVLFLSVWLPHNTFYRLFYLPPLILLLGILLIDYEKRGARRRLRLLLCVLAKGLSNSIFLIYPSGQLQTNRPLSFALRLNRIWGESTRVYYRMYHPDNWIIRYFNPGTEWRALNVENLESFEKEVEALQGRSITAWLDTSAGDALNNGPVPQREWFRRHTRDEDTYQLVDGRHNIRFYRILP